MDTCLYSSSKDEENDTNEDNRPHIVFPGGGLYFYWQAGVITYLRENGYDLSTATLSGGSCGALTATLTAANVDFYQATQLALDLCDEIGVWDRSEGLQGVWGQAIQDWLDELLPEQEIVDLANQHELTVLVTQIPSFQKEKCYGFRDKQDLIECNMASVHIPWFLDGKLTTTFRGNQYIDGSFWVEPELFLPARPNPPTLILDHKMDPILKDKNLLDAVGLVAPEGIWSLLEQGKTYAKTMDEQSNLFEIIPMKSEKQRQESPVELLRKFINS